MEHLLGLPPDASAQGPQIDNLIVLIHWLMFALFTGWGLYFVFVLVRFRSKANPKANYHGVKNHYSTYLEVAVAIIEVILLTAFSIPLWSQRVDKFPDEKDATVVEVTGEQFAWNIHYPGPDGKFGKMSMNLVDSDNPLGLDRTDPDAKDDITTINQLHVPVNKPVLIYLTTKDVIHSFFLPYMRVKQDAIPGERIPLWFTPVKTSVQIREELKSSVSVAPLSVTLDQVTGRTAAKDYMGKDNTPIVKAGDVIMDSTIIAQLRNNGIDQIMVNPDLSGKVAMQDYNDQSGTAILKKGDEITDDAIIKLNAAGITNIISGPETPMEIACAQLCGLGHYRMRGYLTVETQDEFNTWIAQQESALGSGQAPSDSTSTPSDTTNATQPTTTGQGASN
jgi:cytochrome c oxidase subunit 2